MHFHHIDPLTLTLSTAPMQHLLVELTHAPATVPAPRAAIAIFLIAAEAFST